MAAAYRTEIILRNYTAVVFVGVCVFFMYVCMQ